MFCFERLWTLARRCCATHVLSNFAIIQILTTVFWSSHITHWKKKFEGGLGTFILSEKVERWEGQRSSFPRPPLGPARTFDCALRDRYVRKRDQHHDDSAVTGPISSRKTKGLGSRTIPKRKLCWRTLSSPSNYLRPVEKQF